MDKMCCGTCKWSKWDLTKTGKIRKFVAGRCRFPVDKEAIRVFLRDLFDSHRGIWPDDGESCGVKV